MAGNRRWTEDEDEAIRAAASENRDAGKGFGGRGRRISRLRDVASEIGRSYGAVKNRAIRIGAYSRPVGGGVGDGEAAGSQGAQTAA